MTGFGAKLGEALLMAAAMFWDVGWRLVLGFALFAAIQVLVSQRSPCHLLNAAHRKHVP